MKMRFLYIGFLITFSNCYCQIISSVAGTGVQGFNGDTILATNAALKYPYAVIFDAVGNLYIADEQNNRIRKINTSGIITTIAGTGVQGYSGDNGPAVSAKLYYPNGLAFDKNGNLFITDWGNHRVRKIDTAGIITTIAGTGIGGYSGDNGPAIVAKLDGPLGLTFDNLGSLLISEEFNHTIRKVNTSGIITTIAGTGIQGYSGDNGPATSAQLSLPGQIAFDKNGSLYIADEGNNRVRKIDVSGTITTIAGTGVAGYSGDAGPAVAAQIDVPFSVICDFLGNIIFSDAWNNVIRKIDTSGIITTVAGTGFGAGGNCTGTFSGDGGSAIAAELNSPVGLTFDSVGNLYFADGCNHRIRKVTNVGVVVVKQLENPLSLIAIYPNPNSGSFNINISGEGEILTIEIYNFLGSPIISKHFHIGNDPTKIEGLAEGAYIIKLTIDGKYYIAERLIIVK